MALRYVVSKETKKGPGRGRVPRYAHPSVSTRAHRDTPRTPDHVVQVSKPALEPKALTGWRAHSGKFAAAGGAATAATAGGAYLFHRHNQARKEATMSAVGKGLFSQSGPKSQYSSGRTAATQFAPGLHGLVAGKKGKKLRSYGNEALPASVVGGVGGGVAGHLASRGKFKSSIATSVGSMAVGRTAIHAGMRRNQRKGYYKPVEKRMTMELLNPFDGRVYEIEPVAKNFSPKMHDGGPINHLRFVATPSDVTGAPKGDKGLALRRIRGNRKGAAVGSGVPGVRVKTPSFRGGHSGAVSS